MIRNHIFQGDAIASLAQLPDDSINCVVTSPPYWGLRDYGVGGQIGMEATPAEFVAALVRVFAEIRRVLRPDGVCWVNMGDTYNSAPAGSPSADYVLNQDKGDGVYARRYQNNHAGGTGSAMDARRSSGMVASLPSKSRLGMPHRLVFGLQDDGWIWRDEIIWHKPNPMPESVRDRTTKAHEYVFMLTKSPRYWYDQQAIAEDATGDRGNRKAFRGDGAYTSNQSFNNSTPRENEVKGNSGVPNITRTRRSVFSIPSEPTPFAHFATYPQALIEPFILAGCPARTCAVCGAPHVRETATIGMIADGGKRKRFDAPGAKVSDTSVFATGQYALKHSLGFIPTCTCAAATIPGIVYDPFMGSGTTALVARRLGRDYLGSELNPEYHALAVSRLQKDDSIVQMEQRTGATQHVLWETL